MSSFSSTNHRHFQTCLVIIVLLASCKSKKAIADGALDASLSTKNIIRQHYANALDFETMSGKIKITYSEGKSKQGVTVSFRMQRDKALWISAPLGIFKALVTPDRVSFYNKLNGEYFDGDFKFLSELLGYEMDFVKVQNVILGNAVLDMRSEKYVSEQDEETYILQPKQQQELFNILFALEPKYFKVQYQQVTQPEQDRLLKLDYEYQEITSKIIPSTVKVVAIDDANVRNIALDFKSMEFGRKLNFPYRIPKGYKVVGAK